MKIRTGFVSNSSSSSFMCQYPSLFCICKKLMMDDEIKEFRELIKSATDDEIPIKEVGEYFIGVIGDENQSFRDEVDDKFGDRCALIEFKRCEGCD